MEGHCSTGQSPQWSVVPMEEEEEEEEEYTYIYIYTYIYKISYYCIAFTVH